jgi:hypothetical protein
MSIVQEVFMRYVADRRSRFFGHHDESGLVGTALVSMVVMVMVTVPVAFQLQASSQAPIGAQSVYGQAALSAAQAGVQDYVDHLESEGTGYLSSYCSSNYFTPQAGGCTHNGADTANPAFLNDTTSTSVNDRTIPASASKWVNEPTTSGASGNTHGVVESYNYLVDTSSYNPSANGTYPVRVYSTGRAGIGNRYVYRRVKATITVSVTTSPPKVSQPTPPQNPCTGSPPVAGDSSGITVPSWASYAVVSVAGAAGGNGASSLDSNVPPGGAGAAFTAAIPVTPNSSITVVAGCAGETGTVWGGDGNISGGSGAASGGNGSECNSFTTFTCYLFGSSLGGPGGGGGGASAVICTATAQATCGGASSALLAEAGGGGGGGGDALVNLGLGILGGATGGAGGAATVPNCTTSGGCPASLIDNSTAGSGSSVNQGGTGGGGGGTAGAGAGGLGEEAAEGGDQCWLLNGSGCDGGAGGTPTTTGTNGQQTGQCTYHAPSGCADSSLGGGGGGGESGYLAGGVASGNGGGGGGGYNGGGGGGGGGAFLTTGTGAGGGGAGSSYLIPTGVIEPYSTYANTGNGSASITFFSVQVQFAAYTFTSSGPWTPTVPSSFGVACLGPMTVVANGGGGSTGGNTGGAAGGGAELTVTIPAPSATVTDCQSNPTSYVTLVGTLATASSSSGSSGTVGTGFSSGGQGNEGACNSPQCAGGEGGGSTALCLSSPCTAAGGGTALVVAGGGGGGGGKANGNGSPGGIGGNGSITGAAGTAGNGANPGAGGLGGASASITGMTGLGVAGTGAGGGGGGGAGYTNGGGGGSAGGYSVLDGSGGGGGGGGGNSYPSNASVGATGNSGAGSITIYYAYSSTSGSVQTTAGSVLATQIVPSTTTP